VFDCTWKLSNSYGHKKQFRKTILNTQQPKVGEKYFHFFILRTGFAKVLMMRKNLAYAVIL
jgi:hypothetical protein